MDQTSNEFAVLFDNYDLRLVPYLILASRLPNDAPSFSIDSYKLVRRDGEVVVGRTFGSKLITIKGYIIAPTRQAYEETLDELKYRLLIPFERPLTIAQRGIQTSYTVTCDTFGHKFIEGGKSEIIIAFRASNPFGRDSSVTLISKPNVTVGQYNFTEQIGGSAKAYPIFRATINSLTGGTAKTIKFGNAKTGQFIAITRDWQVGDRVVVNNDTADVFVNELPADYSGVFTSFDPRTAAGYYNDDFTARNVSLAVEYQKQYL